MSSSQNNTSLIGLVYQAIRLVPEVRHYLDAELAEKTQAHYNRQMWLYSLALYRNEIDAFGFISDMTEAIEDQLNRAWNEGAREVGIDPQDYEPEDLAMIDGIIKKEYEFILGLGSDIEAAKEVLDMKEFSARFKGRVEMWAMRYKDVVNQAKLHFAKRQKLKWKLGATEQHCSTCAALNGIVAYAREWEEVGIRPQNPPNSALECGGWHCDCSLELTKERRTRNALDKIRSITNA